MRKPKEQVDEEGNEAHFFDDFESSDDADDSDDDSGDPPQTQEAGPPARRAAQRAAVRCAGSSRTGTTTGRTTSTRSCSLSALPAAGRRKPRLSRYGGAVSAKHKRKRPAARPAAGLGFVVEQQPDDVTCGPACLHGIYRHYGDERAARARHRRHPYARQRRHARRVPREPRAAARLRRDDPHATTSRSSIRPGSRCRTTRSAQRLAAQARGEAVAAATGRDARLRRVPAARRQARAARSRAVAAAQVPAARHP